MRDRSSHATAPRVALVAPLLALAAWASACSSQAAPSDDAIARYVAGQAGAPAGSARLPGDPGGPADPTAGGAPMAPRATRIALTVERGIGLTDHDGPGVSDPYVMLEVEGTRVRTSVVEGSLAPVWGDSFAFDIRPDSVLQVRLMDEDSLASDELIGTVVLPIPALAVGQKVQLEAAFKNGDEGKVVLTIVGLGVGLGVTPGVPR